MRSRARTTKKHSTRTRRDESRSTWIRGVVEDHRVMDCAAWRANASTLFLPTAPRVARVPIETTSCDLYLHPSPRPTGSSV